MATWKKILNSGSVDAGDLASPYANDKFLTTDTNGALEWGSALNNFADSLAFSTSTGVLTLGRTGSLADLTVDLDGKYAESSHTHTASDLTLNGSTISDSATLTIDTGDEIHLDTANGIIRFRDDGGDIGMLRNESNDFTIRSMVSDKDILFKGNYGGSVITALTLDMSEGGNATFAGQVRISAGSVSEPSIVFTDDDDGSGTGIYRGGANNIRMAINGVKAFELDASRNLDIDGTITSGSSLTAGGTLYVDENIRHTGDTNNYINFTTDTQKFYTDNTLALTIDSSQNATFGGSVTVNNGDENTMYLNASTGQPAVFFQEDGTNKWEMRGGASDFGFYDYVSSKWALRIRASGKIGLDVPSPSQTLSVQGDTYDNIGILVGTTLYGLITAQGSDIAIKASNSNDIVFHTSGSESVNINSSGNTTFSGTILVNGTSTSEFKGMLKAGRGFTAGQAVDIEGNTFGRTNSSGVAFGYRQDGSGNLMLLEDSTGADMVTITNTGNATFAGQLKVGGGHLATQGTYGLRGYGVGSLGDTNVEYIGMWHSTSGPKLVVDKAGTGSYRSLQIQTGGSTALTLDTSQNATFAGKVALGDAGITSSNEFPVNIDINSSTTQKCGLEVRQHTSGHDARMRFQNANNKYCRFGMSNNGDFFIEPFDGSTYTKEFKLDNDGNASFSGNVEIGTPSHTGHKLHVEGVIGTNSTIHLASSTGLKWSHGDASILEGQSSNYALDFYNYDGSGNNLTLSLNPDHSATFQGSVTATSFISSAGAAWYVNNGDWYTMDDVGIGTSSPSSPLSVAANRGTSTGGIKLLDKEDSDNLRIRLLVAGSGDGEINMYDVDENEDIRLDTAGDSYFNGGNVGIGVATPDGKMHIESGSAGTITAEAYADDLIIENSDHVGISLRSPDAKRGYILFQSATNDRVARISAEYNGGDENLAFAVDDDTKMTINDSGNVGIGATTLKAKLDVDTKAASSTTFGHSDATIQRISAGTAINEYSLLGFNYGNSSSKSNSPVVVGYQIADYSGGTKGDFVVGTRDVVTDTAPVERLRIDSSGNVGIGISPIDNQYKLSINGATNKNAIFSTNIGETGNAITLQAVNDAASALVDLGFRADNLIFATGSSERLRIDSSGNILHQGGSPEYHFGTSSASHYNWRIAVQEVVSGGFEIASGTTSAGSDALTDTYTNRFVIKADTGNVGINDASPPTTLTVNKSATNGFTTDTDALRFLGNSGSSGYRQSIGWIDNNTRNHATVQIGYVGESGSGAGYGHFFVATSPSTTVEAPTERMRITSSGNVGIGTSSPSDYDDSADNFVVYEAGNGGITIANGTSNTGSIYFADGTVGDNAYKGIVKYNHSTNKLTLGANSVDHVTINPSGNVGIGETSPGALLHITGSSGEMIRMTQTGSETWTISAEDGSGTTDYLGIGTSASGNLFVVEDSGKVGIGTTSPADELELKGDGYRFRVSSADHQVAMIGNYGNSGTDIDEGSFALGSSGTTTIELNANANSYFNGGSVGIGETAPDALLTLNMGADDDNCLSLKSSDVAHTITDEQEADTYGILKKLHATNGGFNVLGYGEHKAGVRVRGVGTTEDSTRSTSGNAPVVLSARAKVSAGSGALSADKNLVVIQNNSTTKFIFDSDGDAHADSSWTTFSDRRLKNNITSIPYGLNEVLQLSPKVYDKHSGYINNDSEHENYNDYDDGEVVLSQDSKRMIGFIAQDVKDVLPEMIKDVDESSSFYSMSNADIVPVLVKAIQELSARVAELESK